MRRAFSKPTRSQDELVRLMTGYREAGFEGLQLKTGQFAPWLDDVESYLRVWGQDPGRASGLVLFDTLEPAGLEKLDATIRFAERVGGERVVFCHDHPRDGVSRQDVQEFARILSRAGSDARQRGVALSLHHHFGHPVMRPEDFQAFFDAAEPGAVGLTVDTAHLAKSGIDDIPAFVGQWAHVIDNIHLKDYSDGEWRLLGEGDLDLEAVLAALEAHQYAGWLCADEESPADLETGMAASARWLDARARR